MVRWSDFSLQNVQVSGFAQEDGLRPASVLQQALREWGDVFDAVPLSLPLPMDLPGNIPSVILSSVDQVYRMEIARGRLNLFWQAQASPSTTFGEGLDLLSGWLDNVFTQAQVPVGRLAAVITWRAFLDHPAVTVARQFVRDEWLGRAVHEPDNFELHVHKRFHLFEDLEVNSWIRIKTVPLREQQGPMLQVEQDINSLAEEADTRRFSSDDLRAFFREMSRAIPEILTLYFPDAR